MDLMDFAKNKIKRPATEKQIEFAKRIADTLEISEPDFSDFAAVSVFISENIDDYNDARDYGDDAW